MTFFTNIAAAPRDPILGLNEAFAEDKRPHKTNLGIGIYQNDDGILPTLKAVTKVITQRLNNSDSKVSGYLPIDGLASYNQQVQNLLFGAQNPIIAQKRAVTCQSLGGTGAIKIGADFLYHNLNMRNVAISNPSWENHQAIFTQAGFKVSSYRYYDHKNKCLDLNGMLEDLVQLPAQSVVVLHACCHNPTGFDLTLAEFEQVLEVLKAQSHLPFIDMAYQGFAHSLEQDAAFIRKLAETNLEFLVANSFSKSFSLYGERVGALTVVCQDKNTATKVQTQIKCTIRTNYSSPPTFGASIVSDVLASSELHQLWQDELESMRMRILSMRTQLAEELQQLKAGDFSFITRQKGMFSYSGLTVEQVTRLRDEFAIYAVLSGRICVAALNSRNLSTVAQAIKAVM